MPMDKAISHFRIGKNTVYTTHRYLLKENQKRSIYLATG